MATNEQFPDLEKAIKAISLADFIEQKKGEELFTPAKRERDKQSKQYKDDFCTFVKSQGVAIKTGNNIACQSQHQAEAQTQQQLLNNAITNGIKFSSSSLVTVYGKGKKQIALPKTKNANPTNRQINKSIGDIQYGREKDTQTTYYLPRLGNQTQNNPTRQKEQYKRFVQAQAGRRRNQLGDRAVVYSHNGTPLYGDEILRQSDRKNLSANLATAVPPVAEAPKKIRVAKPIKGSVDRQARGQSRPKSNTVGNMMILLGIAGAVSAVMFALQYVVQIIGFVFQIQNLMNATTNVSSSFLNLFNNIGALLGMGENVTKPLGDTIDGILNNIFGKENVQAAKYQAARINTIVNAGINILDRTRSMSQTLGNAISQNANNTSRLGNLLITAGLLDQKADMFEENIRVEIAKGGKLNQAAAALNVIGEVTQDLADITEEVKTAKEQLETLDKQFDEQQKKQEKEAKKGKEEANNKYFDKSLPQVANFNQSDL